MSEWEQAEAGSRPPGCMQTKCCTPKRCASQSPGGHFPFSTDRLLTFWLAVRLTLPVHHWGLSIPQHLETAHKFKGLSMNSASQHPLKELHHTAIKKNSSFPDVHLLAGKTEKKKSRKQMTWNAVQKRKSWVLTDTDRVIFSYFCCAFTPLTQRRISADFVVKIQWNLHCFNFSNPTWSMTLITCYSFTG